MPSSSVRTFTDPDECATAQNNSTNETTVWRSGGYSAKHVLIVLPVAQRGALLAIGNAVGTLAGIIAPDVTDSVIEAAATPLEGFNTRFKICGAIMVAGGAIGMTLAGG